MANFFQSFTVGSKAILGVDIGTSSIKAVQLEKGGARPRLTNYALLESSGHLDRINDAIQTSTLKMVEDQTIELLKTMLSQAKFKTTDTIASLPPFAAFVTLIEVPQMPEADTARTLQFQIRKHIPLPVAEVAIEWLKVGEREDEHGTVKQEILIISTPTSELEKYKRIFKACGLTLRALEVESLSLIRSITNKAPAPTLVVDIGSRSTNIAVVERGYLLHNRQSDFSSSSLTHAIANGLKISMRRAEELKRQKGLLGGGGEYELSTLPYPFLDAIISEVRRAQTAYNEAHKEKISRVLLTGGGSNLLGLEQYFNDQMGLPVAIGDPFANVDYPQEVEPLIKDLRTPLAVSIGLGMREFS